MKIGNNIYNYKQNYNLRTNFAGKTQATKFLSKKSYKLSMPILIASLLTLIGVNFNSKSEKYSQINDYNTFTVEYQDVHKETKDFFIKPLLDFNSQITSKNNFLDNLKIDVVRSFPRIKPNDSFSEYVKENKRGSYIKGLSFYSDSKIPKRIIIQEKAHKNRYESGINAIKEMHQTLMHEIGHQFDNYYGHNHKDEFALKWDSMQYSKFSSKNESPYNFASKTAEEKRIDDYYAANSGLSDNEKFQQAFLKDLKIIKNYKNTTTFLMPQNIKYYLKDIDIDNITIEKVKKADFERAEVYANLFSYAVGQDEGDKEKFISVFPNCYEIVKKDINTYLK